MALAPTACAPADPDFGIQLQDINLRQAENGLSVTARQRLDLSREARAALRAGVPLRFRIDVSLRLAGGMRASASESFVYELSYLPLSRRYQLKGPDESRPATSYPRLRHALAAMTTIELPVTEFKAQAATVTLRLRSRLDRAAMPGPMQLPVWLSPDWNHDSGWQAREFELNG